MTNLRIYVGTYKKYNEGSLYGAWLDLEDYSDFEELQEAMQELHKNEEVIEAYMYCVGSGSNDFQDILAKVNESVNSLLNFLLNSFK